MSDRGVRFRHMSTVDALVDILHGIDGRGYKAYEALRGDWEFSDFVLRVDHVQGDPFATPSRVRVFLTGQATGLAPEACATASRRLGVGSFLARRFHESAGRSRRRRGSGKSGVIEIENPGQEVLDQTAVMVAPDGGVEARFLVGLPADGRRVLGGEAVNLLTTDVPAVVDAALRAHAVSADGILEHALTNEDAEALRAHLGERGWIAFVADGAILPRRSGIDDRPLEEPSAVPFSSPERLRVSVELPNAGTITGMALPRGITLIVGGGYHGKSTLLRALERGVYNHSPGDGREHVVTEAGAVKIRAEDGRSVAGVDISPFIDGLPQGQDTRAFSTVNASGSTSQAAAIMEALEVGASTLLIDEDTAATNFMIRDRRMQALVPKAGEPITPFVDRISALYEEKGVSSVVVLGGSGDYLDTADVVVAMKEFRPADVSEEARRVAAELPTGRQAEVAGPIGSRPGRAPLPASVDPSRGRRAVDLRVRDRETLVFGREVIDLSAVEQLVSRAQTRAIGRALVLARNEIMDGRRTVSQILKLLDGIIEERGLDALDERQAGDLAAYRPAELAAALNRLRTLRVRSIRVDPRAGAPPEPGRTPEFESSAQRHVSEEE